MIERLDVQPRIRPLAGARIGLQLVLVLSLAAIALRRPEVLAVVAPIVLGLAVDLAARRPSRATVEVEIGSGRVLVGDDVPVRVTLRAAGGPQGCQLTLHPTRELTGDGVGVVHDVCVGQPVELSLRASRWGIAGIERVDVAWRSPLGLLGGGAECTPQARPVRIHPPTTELRSLLRPRTTGAWAGARPSGVPGRGVEFAELRPFAAGDLPRDVSWRVTARRGEPWVAARHPERSTDVVLLLDAFVPDALDDVVEAAATLLDAHLRARDRVGVIGLSGVLRWVPLGGGDRHRHRVLDLLLRTQVVAGWATRKVGTVPAAALPPGAIVIVLTHLGPTMVDVVADLRARRRDVVVIDLTGDDDEHRASEDEPDELDELTSRLVALRRSGRRERLRRMGATVVATDELGIAAALAAGVAVRRARVVAP